MFFFSFQLLVPAKPPNINEELLEFQANLSHLRFKAFTNVEKNHCVSDRLLNLHRAVLLNREAYLGCLERAAGDPLEIGITEQANSEFWKSFRATCQKFESSCLLLSTMCKKFDAAIRALANGHLNALENFGDQLKDLE